MDVTHRTPVVLVCVLICSAALCGCHHASVNAEKTPEPASGTLRVSAGLIDSGQVQVEQVSVSSETVALRTSGKVGFDEDHLSYVSSPLSGRVIDIRVHPGDHVTAGQVLTVIDSPDLGAASSEFIKARADLILAQRNYSLAQDLLKAKALARKDFQKSEDEFVKAEADLRRTRERLISLGVVAADLDGPLEALHVRSQFNLAAPIAGTVVERSLTLGQIVGGEAAQRLFVLAELGTLWVTADIYEKDLPLVHPGEDVMVQAGAWPDEQFKGRINYVGETVAPTSRTVKVRLAVDNQHALLKPEMFVTATVHTTTSGTVLTVPVAAVHGEGSGQSYVFTILDDYRVVRRPVTLGAKVNDRVTVTAGLSAQDRVVTSGSILLKAEADRQANS